MRTCPPQLYHTDSKAERLVFHQLKQVFNDKPSYVAMHSVQLTNHPNKRFAEIDFLLCTNIGLFVLEVKGGQVSCQNGVWHYQDKDGNHNTGGSPFHQASGAMQGLRQSLLNHFDKKRVDSICFGYGVILTDSVLPDNVLTTLEYDKSMLCQNGEHQHLQKWLTQFFAYWQKRNQAIIKNIEPLSDKQLADIINFIRPNFDNQIKKTSEVSLTIHHNVNNDIKTEFMQFFNNYYEKMVNDVYYSAKDITIIVDNDSELTVVEWLNSLRITLKKVDEYSFNFRKSYELSVMSYNSTLKFKNKIVIAVLNQTVNDNSINIRSFATQIAQVFYINTKN